MFEIAGDRDALSVAEVSVDIVPQRCRERAALTPLVGMIAISRE
jgi:hypothetical protein